MDGYIVGAAMRRGELPALMMTGCTWGWGCSRKVERAAQYVPLERLTEVRILVGAGR